MTYYKHFFIDKVSKARNPEILQRAVKKHPYVYMVTEPYMACDRIRVCYYYNPTLLGRIKHLWNWPKWKKLYARYEDGYYRVWLSGDEMFFELFGKELQ